MSSASSTRKTLVALLVCAALGSSACAQLPLYGEVQAANPDLPTGPPLGQTAAGPAQDASAEKIVQGFLRACSAGYSDDFTVARSFLGIATAKQWQPDKQVRIFPSDSDLSISRQQDGAFVVTVSAVASVDSAGIYVESGQGSKISASFSLAKGIDQQWRIASLEDGIILSESAFSSAYAASTLYFLSPDRQRLVPELRWYPRRRQAAYMMQGLLEGPSASLTGAVTTSFPTGTTLPLKTVNISEGIAQVELSSEAQGQDEATRANMYWQAEATLRALPAVSKVSLTIGDAPIEPALMPAQTASDPPLAVMIKEGQIVTRQDAKFSVLVGGEILAGLSPNHPAVAPGGAPLVFLDADSRLMIVPQGGRAPIVLMEAAQLLPPSVDSLGWIWTGNPAEDRIVKVVASNGTQLSLPLGGAHDGKLLGLRVSPDGARLAMLWETNEGTRIDVHAVVRDTQGTPSGLGPPLRMGEAITNVRAMTWISGTNIAVLTSSPSEQMKVHIMELSGPSRTLSAVKGAISIASSVDERQLMLATSDGQLFVRNGANWRLVGDDVRDPQFSG
ncbi:MAG: LpqB family beta-propeller domain-containing protein [Actinomycetaceae bacterium]|nr:LpqB family beta-propeller domain-containing protein [Actinomycetaceae bacterium]